MVHTTLRHPDLRVRDIKHIVALKRFDIQWDDGQVRESEWVYVSLEDDAHRDRLLAWLRSKDLDWRLDYRQWGVARFGRWHYKQPSNQSLQPTAGRSGV